MNKIYLIVFSLAVSKTGFKATAMECLEAMASGLYSELFTILISLINRLVFPLWYFLEAVSI